MVGTYILANAFGKYVKLCLQSLILLAYKSLKKKK